MADFRKAQQIVGISEGGYQDDPRDSGNYYMGHLIGTNWGISAPTLAGYLGRIPLKSEMQNLSRQTAEDILKRYYWLRNNLERLKNQSVATLIYDGVVNHGTNGMRFLIERVLTTFGQSIPYYEVFSLKGIGLLNRLKERELFHAIKGARTRKYKSSPKTYFHASWLSRLDRIKFYPTNTLSGIWPYMVLFVGVCGILLIALP